VRRFVWALAKQQQCCGGPRQPVTIPKYVIEASMHTVAFLNQKTAANASAVSVGWCMCDSVVGGGGGRYSTMRTQEVIRCSKTPVL